jgi:hypothetical protein
MPQVQHKVKIMRLFEYRNLPATLKWEIILFATELRLNTPSEYSRTSELPRPEIPESSERDRFLWYVLGRRRKQYQV